MWNIHPITVAEENKEYEGEVNFKRKLLKKTFQK